MYPLCQDTDSRLINKPKVRCGSQKQADFASHSDKLQSLHRVSIRLAGFLGRLKKCSQPHRPCREQEVHEKLPADYQPAELIRIRCRPLPPEKTVTSSSYLLNLPSSPRWNAWGRRSCCHNSRLSLRKVRRNPSDLLYHDLPLTHFRLHHPLSTLFTILTLPQWAS